MAPVLLAKDKSKTKSVPYRGPVELVASIDEAAKQLGLSRNEAMTQLLRFALEAHQKEQAKKPRR